MNSEEEILLIPDEDGKFYKPFCSVFYKTKEDFEFMEAAVRKARAEKPHLWGDGYYKGELIIDMYTCPNCEKNYELECEEYDYCPNCGQKIDWSEVEDD